MWPIMTDAIAALRVARRDYNLSGDRRRLAADLRRIGRALMDWAQRIEEG